MCLSFVQCPAKHLLMSDAKSLIINEFQFRFFQSIEQVALFYPPQYNAVPNHFLHPNYWSAIETAPPKGVRFAYLTIEKQGQTVGFLAAQIQRFEAAKSLNFDENEIANFGQKILRGGQKWLAEQISYNTLIIGNLLLTGEHGFWIDPKLSLATQQQIFTEGVIFLKKTLAQKGTQTGAVLLKEFYQNSSNHQIVQILNQQKYHEYQVEPSFVVDIKSDWLTFENYLESLATKYRTRAKRAFKKLGNEVVFKPFSLAEISDKELEINELYKAVAYKSGFNLTILPTDYFTKMKTELGEKFQLYAYLKSEELIGFFTLIENGDELDAHTVGYKLSLNAEYQTYLNMLFDMLRLAISMGKQRLILSRTAHEIKSSIGAEAHEMSLFFKHDNPIWNYFFPRILRFLAPREQWQPRQPFKKMAEKVEILTPQ